MEWYYVAAIIAAYFIALFGIMYACKKGFISKENMSSISGIAGGLDTVAKVLATSNNGNQIFNIASMLTTFVNSAVLAAENAWYNNTIDKEQRHEYCIMKLSEMLEACGVVVPDEQMAIIETLIAAACEQMGHSNEGKTGD